MNSTTEHAGATWEDALNFDVETVEMPDLKSRGVGDGMSNQMGLVTTANANFEKSKNKLSQLHLVGV